MSQPLLHLPLLRLQAIQAGQVTVEDHFMSELGMHPLKVNPAAAAAAATAPDC
jgi:hypothetical protein